MTEHRRHARTPIELEVGYKRLNSFFAEYTKNISKGGTFIKTRKPLPVGTRFLFRLQVPTCAEAFAVEGEVVREDGQGAEPGMAIRFLWQDDAARLAFEAGVERLMVENLGPQVAAELLRGGRSTE
jgi:type IV pilus assembly protein PilZ